MQLRAMMMSVCLSFSIGCAAPPVVNLQDSERIHWRADVQAYEMSRATLDATYGDCLFVPAPTDDQVKPSDTDGWVLVTEGFLSRVMNACEVEGTLRP